MDNRMFCFQCEQTAGCAGCTGKAGVCGKTTEVAELQDQLTGALVGLSRAVDNAPDTNEGTWRLMIEGLFTTVTNVNFNEKTIRDLIDRVHAEKARLVPNCYSILVLCIVLIAAILAGCGAAEQRPALDRIEYTNLNDSGSRELLKELLSEIGVSDERVQGFFRRVDHFHDSVKQEWLTDGFEKAELLYTKYDTYAMQDEWTAKNGTFPGYNCRITAMNLFGDFLSVSADSQINAGEDVLFVDEEALKTDPDALGGSSLADFRALYSSMKAEDTTEIKRHVQTVQEEWASRGVTFRENERIRLITVFFHDKPTEEESLLFVGHVGVLLTAKDGTLYFVEKVAFQEPYRMLRFVDRTALSDYLMGKYDTSWGQDTASPFIMENDKLMDGWRPNPNRGSSALD